MPTAATTKEDSCSKLVQNHPHDFTKKHLFYGSDRIENDLWRREGQSLITTLGGTIAAVCSRCQSQRDYEFATHRRVDYDR